MKSRTEWLLVGLASAGVATVTLVPYLAATGLVHEGRIFSGFLINPVDGYSYLAKMRQGLGGAWGFTLPYAGTPPGSASIFLFYLGLGHLAGILHAPLMTTYQAARVVAAFVMFLSAYSFLRAVIDDGLARLVAFTLVLIGSGLGWLGLAVGIQGSDLLIPESIPFVTAFTNPHFPAALALVAIGARLIVGNDEWRARLWMGLLVGLGLGIVLPFAVVPVVAAGGAWSVWETLRGRPTDRSSVLRQPGFVAAVGVALGAVPWLVYDFWVVTTHPAYAAWNAQNLTASPPLWDYVAGFAVVLIWGLYAVWRCDALAGRRGRFLVAWLVVNSLLLYAPFNLQRRFSLGLFLPLAALAGMGVAASVRRSGSRGWLLLAFSLLLSLPSNGLVVGAGLASAASGSSAVTQTTGESHAYAWLGEHAAPGAVVLAAPETGIRLPAYAPVKVVAGHPFETPDAANRDQQLVALFDGSISPGAVSRLLADWDVSYVFYGPSERSLGPVPDWMAPIRPAFRDGGVTIYAWSPP